MLLLSRKQELLRPCSTYSAMKVRTRKKHICTRESAGKAGKRISKLSWTPGHGWLSWNALVGPSKENQNEKPPHFAGSHETCLPFVSPLFGGCFTEKQPTLATYALPYTEPTLDQGIIDTAERCAACRRATSSSLKASSGSWSKMVLASCRERVTRAWCFGVAMLVTPNFDTR